MSYEREMLTNTPPAVAAPALMREERVMDPYQMTSTPKRTIGQNDTREAPQDKAAVRTPEESVKLSPQVAALARREQKFRSLQQQLEKDRATLAAEKQEIAQLKAMKEKLAAKDYSALEGLVDYNDYSQYQVNRLNGTDPTQEELKKLNGKIQELEKFTEENVTKQFEAAVQERRQAAEALVNTGDQFPRIKKAKAHEAVVQHILDTWEHDSQELTVEQAAKEVEECLLEKAKQWASLLEDQKKQEAQDEKKPLPPMKAGLKTLTNQVTAGEYKRPNKSLYHMSDAERWAEARRRAEEKLQLQRQ